MVLSIMAYANDTASARTFIICYDLNHDRVEHKECGDNWV